MSISALYFLLSVGVMGAIIGAPIIGFVFALGFGLLIFALNIVTLILALAVSMLHSTPTTPHMSSANMAPYHHQ
ncbi:hypothetical protein JL49_07995 [Pseudoalteromonas luteoviolacea]|nr:hypothetical protein JL49_07995 [Pseudoalteromonas luteoviolacea]